VRDPLMNRLTQTQHTPRKNEKKSKKMNNERRPR
jgi:hypothetical protein